jgi:hypothetical protein
MGYEFEALDLTQTEGISQKHYTHFNFVKLAIKI